MTAVSLLVRIHYHLSVQCLVYNRPSINRKDKGKKARWFVQTRILPLLHLLLSNGEETPLITISLMYSWTKHLSTPVYELASFMNSISIVYPESNHFSPPLLPLPWSKPQQPSCQNFGFYSEIDGK